MRFKKDQVFYVVAECLYYLFERQKDYNIYEVFHNPEFNPNNQMVKYEFIKRYFSM